MKQTLAEILAESLKGKHVDIFPHGEEAPIVSGRVHDVTYMDVAELFVFWVDDNNGKITTRFVSPSTYKFEII